MSLGLQKSDITLPVANKLIAREVQVFAARKRGDNDSINEHYLAACQAVETGVFEGVSVGNTPGNEKEICKEKFY